MELDRGTLARFDRKLLAGLGQGEMYRLVRVPVTASKWSTWKRYCESGGISMGRAIATLIDHELSGLLGGFDGGGRPLLADQANEELSRPQTHVSLRKEKVVAVDKWIRAREAHLGTREGWTVLAEPCSVQRSSPSGPGRR